MNRTRLIAVVRLAPFALLASGGCLSTLNAGFQDDGGARTSASSAGTAASSGTSASSTGRAVTGSSQGSSSGVGTSSGSVQGTSSGGGTSSGTTGGDAGPCKPFGSSCGSNARCCSGVCNGTCREALGDACFGDSDCSSNNCVNEQCACGPPQGQEQQGACAVDADCCNGDSCSFFTEGGVQYGACCNQVGVACQGSTDCCNGNCNNNLCACLPTGSINACAVDSDCCQGKCIFDAAQRLTECENGPGEPCTSSSDCSTESCVDGGCGSCSVANGACTTGNDCCGGLTCATEVSASSFVGQICCLADGSACSGGGDCCSQVCTKGSCGCGNPGDTCTNDQSCCSGGSCETRLINSGTFNCCQKVGQTCLSDGECCSDSCQNQQCACVAAGGNCGLPGRNNYYGDQACCSGACGDAGACL